MSVPEMVFSSLRFSQTSPTEGKLTSVLRRPLGSLALSMSMSSLEPLGIIGRVGDRSAPRRVACRVVLAGVLPKLLFEALSCAPERMSLGLSLIHISEPTRPY